MLRFIVFSVGSLGALEVVPWICLVMCEKYSCVLYCRVTKYSIVLTNGSASPCHDVKCM
jgi:hypothetical protein